MVKLSELLSGFSYYDDFYEDFKYIDPPLVRDIKLNPYTNIIGREVSDINDLIIIGTLCRNPKIERFWILYIKDNKIIGHDIIPGNHFSVSVRKKNKDFKGVLISYKKKMIENGADSYILLHNHPGLSASTPSKADIDTTSNFINFIPGFICHIITDNDHCMIIDEDLKIKSYNYSKENVIEPDTTDDSLVGKKLNIHNIINDPKYSGSLLIYLDNGLKIASIQSVSDYEFKDTDNFLKVVRNFEDKIGASRVYAFTYNSDLYDDIMRILLTQKNSNLRTGFMACIYVDVDSKRFSIWDQKKLEDFGQKNLKYSELLEQFLKLGYEPPSEQLKNYNED